MTDTYEPVEEEYLEETEGEDQDYESETEEEQYEEEEQSMEKPRKPNIVKQQREEIKKLKQALKEKEKSEVRLKPDQEVEARFFFVENPEAKDFKDDIKSTIAKHPSMTFEEAFALVKALRPKESVSKQDFNLRTRSKPQDMMSLSDDEAAEQLSPSEYLKYTRQKGSSFIKSGRK